MRVVLLLAASLLATPTACGEDPPPIEKKDVLRSQENLKQIGLAFHAYADAAIGNLPVDIPDANGKPLLSWRVTILPYMEEKDLYKQFKLDEPWDSANNKKLIEKMPKVYSPVRVKAKAGETYYQVFSGEGSPFGPMKIPRLPASFPDGLSRTGLVFEAGEPVVWTKPADMDFGPKKPVPKLGGLFDGECNVVLANGDVIQLRKKPDEKLLRLFVIPNDGYVLDLEKLKTGGKN